MTTKGVKIEDRVWSAWRQAAEDDPEWTLRLALVPCGDSATAERAVRLAVREVALALEAAITGVVDPPLMGEWSPVRTSTHVLVWVTESDSFESALPEVAAHLGRQGIEGTIELAEEPLGVNVPADAQMLACRARVAGERMHEEPGLYRWQPDENAARSFLTAAASWCRSPRRAVLASLRIGVTDPLPVDPNEDVVDRMIDALANESRVRLTAVARDGFRGVEANLWGGISLVVGGPAVENAWASALDALVGLLGDHATSLVYGYVTRGWDVEQALTGRSLSYDWPQRPDEQPSGAGLSRYAFEDLYAPDAFGVQLLGPRYADRLVDHADWRIDRLAGSRSLLRHSTPAAWFSEPFVPPGERMAPSLRPQSELLSRSRRELAPLLHNSTALAAAGFTDMIEA